MNIRDTPIYAKHFAADAEPEEHARISIQYAIDIMEALRDEWFINSDGYKQLNSKMLELQQSL
jgi:hypothetical protein